MGVLKRERQMQHFHGNTAAVCGINKDIYHYFQQNSFASFFKIATFVQVCVGAGVKKLLRRK